ncbi:DOMON domain-containing protein [Moraxella pluranimalium]|uniref:Uncharacterized protein n=1 Tax=Moraxella pluranimalium TaxID=470453 RepID=A0A1T0CLW2_9GAMM|nr:hypothetical protein [Moraxella pluranimalium]OOS23326.1 hypothetical protein B0680_07025 [Moraxella pluranimalium]
MNLHRLLFTHRVIETVRTFPLIAVIDGDFVHLDKVVSVPAITASVSVMDGAMQVSFMVEKTCHTKDVFAVADLGESAKQLPMCRADFLWQQDCFECFIGHMDEPAYLEINANTAGEFNSYQFDDYRTPDVMPPVANHAYDVQSFAHQDEVAFCFGFEVANEATETTTSIDVARLKINPTVILYPVIDSQAVPIYYAYQHAVPPDFHQRAVWQNVV